MPVGLPKPANLFRISVQTQPTAPQGAPVGTPSASGGTLAAGNHFAVITPLNAAGEGLPSAEGLAVTTGATGSIVWNWPAVPDATSYHIWVSVTTGTEGSFFTSATNTFTQTATSGSGAVLPNQGNMIYAPVSLMHDFDISGAENVAAFDVFDSDDPVEFAGKQRRTLTTSGFLADATDTGQTRLFAAAAGKWVVTIKVLWDSVANDGFIQPVRVNAYKGAAKAGNNPIDASFDFFPGTAAGTIIGAGPLL